MLKAIIFLIFLSVFYVFVFNTGYGCDALEFLVNGHAISEGHPFFTFTPHKPWALYLIVAGFFSLGVSPDHYGVTFIITFIFAALVLATFFVSGRLFGKKTALISCGLVALAAIFMELNFLLAEGWLYFFGILAFYFLAKGVEKNMTRDLFLGGFLLGACVWFKVSALVYYPAVVSFLAFWGMRIERLPFKKNLARIGVFSGGFFSAFFISIAYFSISGSLKEYLFWGFCFPVFGAESSNIWFYKLYNKLLWFFVLAVLILLLSFKKEMRKRVYSDASCVLLLFLSAFPLGLLFKNQSPHYIFTGAGFFSVFMAAVVGVYIENKDNLIRVRLGLIGLIVLALISVLLHSPQRLNPKNFLGFKDYASEKKISATLKNFLPTGKKAIFFRSDSAFYYWITQSYPNVPFVYFNEWASYFLKKNPDLLLIALSDPELVLVEFNSKSLDILEKGSVLWQDSLHRKVVSDFLLKLSQDFTVIDTDIPDDRFWVRKNTFK